MSHYYINDKSLKSNQKEIDFSCLGITLKLTTDNGVFSKRGIDFGSKLLLENIALKSPKTIIDMGAGYGVIGLFLAKKYTDSKVTLFDINERAIELIDKNIKNNLIDNAIAILSDRFEKCDFKADLIVTNPPIRAGKKVVFSIYDESRDHLKKNGILMIVIQKKQGALSSFAYLETLFDEVKIIDRSKGYQIIQAKFPKMY
ncbi:class I SAM-dependent methyltransferase [Acholeplasma sp. OttesenSCG-928-E16]|nr:class I SAM-dependent methyltransferase [Acholeplasma sp. OttesenSCG-928-E16]